MRSSPPSKREEGGALRGAWRSLPARARFGLPAGLVAAVLFALARAAPGVAEELYSQRFYPVVARSLAGLSALVPFSLTELSFAAAGALVIVSPVCAGLSALRARAGTAAALGRALLTLLGEIGWIWALFLVLWGFNYARPEATELFDLGGSVASDRATAIARIAAARCEDLRDRLEEGDDGVMRSTLTGDELRAEVERSQRRVLERLGLPAAPGSRVKTLMTPLAARWSVSGVYGPFTAEPNVLGGLLPPDAPFVMAHERAHYAGLADEDAASFVALLTLWESSDVTLRYAGWLAFSSRLPVPSSKRSDAVRRDLEAIAHFYRSRRGGEAPAVTKVYDAFLETHGVSDGVASYGRATDLALRHLDGVIPSIEEE